MRLSLDTAEQLYTQFSEQGYDRIKNAVDDREAEGLFIDFKESGGSGGKMTPDDRKNLGKLLSAYANAEGGVIVWGVRAKIVKDGDEDRQAVEFAPIANARRFRDELNNYTAQEVRPPVSGVLHHLIDDPTNEGAGYLITLVPQSPRPPHMCVSAKEDRYYYRSGSQSQRMQHGHVEALFNLVSVPRMSVLSLGPEVKFNSTNQCYYAVVTLLADNRGHALARNIALTFTSSPFTQLQTGLPMATRYSLPIRTPVPDDDTTTGESFRLYPFSPDIAIYPDTEVELGRVMYTPAREDFQDLRIKGVLYTERSWVPYDFTITANELMIGIVSAKQTYSYDYED